MIKLPLKQLIELVKVINKDEYKIVSIKVCLDNTLNREFGEFSSPLALYKIKYINKTNESFSFTITEVYYVYLIDIISQKVIGEGLKVNPDSSFNTIELAFTYLGVVGINDRNIKGDQQLINIINQGPYSTYMFVKNTEWNSVITTPYKNWMLEFISKREAFLSLSQYIKNDLYKTRLMKEHYKEICDVKDKLYVDIKTLLSNYPYIV